MGSNRRCSEPSSSTSRSPPIDLPRTSRKIGTHPTIKWYQVAIAETARRESGIQHASPVKHEQRAPSSSSNAIKLKSHAMFATKSDLAVSTNVDVSFHALVCQQVLFSLEDIITPLPHAITNL
jgi:hypothetical protein